jgi:hypothetical protein
MCGQQIRDSGDMTRVHARPAGKALAALSYRSEGQSSGTLVGTDVGQQFGIGRVAARVVFAASLLTLSILIAHWMGSVGWSGTLTGASNTVVAADVFFAWFLTERKLRRARSTSARS